jgi:dTDP-4-dehydrorhamnose reductase
VRLLGPEIAVPHNRLSITDASAVEALIAARKPETVFNCAAYNAVDRAEAEPDAAYAVNSRGPFNVATACARHRTQLVHFSTNFVFDGKLDRPYVESDQPSPQSAYARSKLEGERSVLDALPGAIVLRTAGLFGGNRGQSFPERILQRATEGGPLRVVADQRVNPTYSLDLARAALELAENGANGVFHAVSDGCCTWSDFARAVLDEFDVRVQVDEVSTAEFASPAPRPLNGCLASVRFHPLRHWREALHFWARQARGGGVKA